ncbi:MAG: YtxH domain-containing protein [Microgenomates group bacterium]
MSKNKSGFFLAGLIGALAGAVGGLLLAPKSGKETRQDIARLAADISKRIKTETNETKERVKDVFGKATEEATDKYNQVKNAVVGKVATLRTAGENIDKDKYAKVVDDVVAEFKDDFRSSKSGAEKIVGYLKKDWEKLKKALA